MRNNKRLKEEGQKQGRPGVILDDCVAIGNGGSGFVFENIDVVGKNLVARDNGEEGIKVIDSRGDLIDPDVE